MPDYEKLFYESQAQLADIEEELRKLVLRIQSLMRRTEEQILSEDEPEN